MEKDVLRGLQAGEFYLEYQPIVEVKGKKEVEVIGAEALLRWEHPRRGTLYPGSYIREIEGTKTIRILGEWVIDEVIKQQLIWKEEGISIKRININIGVNHMKDGRLGDYLGEGIIKGGLKGDLFGIELTEYINIGEAEARGIQENLQILKELGVGVYIDDYEKRLGEKDVIEDLGIKNYKVSLLGLDERGIEKVLEEVKKLDKTFIIEGVEKKGVVDCVVEEGIIQMQGYYYFKALENGIYGQLLKES